MDRSINSVPSQEWSLPLDSISLADDWCIYSIRIIIITYYAGAYELEQHALQPKRYSLRIKTALILNYNCTFFANNFRTVFVRSFIFVFVVAIFVGFRFVARLARK